MRIASPRPTFLVVLFPGSDYAPPEDINDFYIATLKQDTKWQRREIQQFSIGLWSQRVGEQTKDAIPSDVIEVVKGTFRILPRGDLAQGEYCIFKLAPSPSGPVIVQVFDFGIDLAK